MLRNLIRTIPSQTTIYQDKCPNTKRDNLKVCNLCEKYCPVDAIKTDGKIQILLDKCIECGICSAQCPNDVFQFHFISDHILHQKILEILKTNDSIFFECNWIHGIFKTRKQKTNHEHAIIVPCLGSISEISIILSFIMGSTNLEFGECPEECKNYRGAAAHKRILHIINSLLQTINLKKKTLVNNDSTMLIKEISFPNRRQFITTFKPILSKTLKEMLIPLILMGNLTKQSPQKRLNSTYSRRKLLLDIIENYGISSYIIKMNEVPYGEIIINIENCTLCGICSHYCPTSAVLKTEKKSMASLNFVFGLCTGCGLCVKVCPEKVIHLRKTVDLGFLNNPSRNLIQKKILTCSSCTSKFIEDSSSDICLSCRKRKRVLTNV